MEKRRGHGALFALVAVFFGIAVFSGSAAPTTSSRKFLDSGTVLRRSMLANGLAKTPPMGWNSWNHFNCSIDEKMIRETADALVSTGLAKLGYQYVNIDDCCAESSRDDKGYLVAKKSTFPSGIKALAVFLSEWGFDQRGVNVNDNRYLNCLLGFAAKLDLDWALWTLPGSYYLREGVFGMDETYWVLDYNWCGTRNSSFIQKISALQSPFQRPELTNVHPHQIIFHPATSLCIVRKSLVEPLQLGSCTKSDEWTYTPQKALVIKGTYFCLQADGVGKPAKLGIICSGFNSKWEMISDSKMHLSSKLLDGTTVCLDVDSGNNVVTNLCSCLNVDPTCDPKSQWFKIVNSTRSS